MKEALNKIQKVMSVPKETPEQEEVRRKKYNEEFMLIERKPLTDSGIVQLFEEISKSGLVKSSKNADGSFEPAKIVWEDTDSRYEHHIVIELRFNYGERNGSVDHLYDYIQAEIENSVLVVRGGRGWDREFKVENGLEIAEVVGLALRSPGEEWVGTSIDYDVP